MLSIQSLISKGFWCDFRWMVGRVATELSTYFIDFKNLLILQYWKCPQ